LTDSPLLTEEELVAAGANFVAAPQLQRHHLVCHTPVQGKDTLWIIAAGAKSDVLVSDCMLCTSPFTELIKCAQTHWSLPSSRLIITRGGFYATRRQTRFSAGKGQCLGRAWIAFWISIESGFGIIFIYALQFQRDEMYTTAMRVYDRNFGCIIWNVIRWLPENKIAVVVRLQALQLHYVIYYDGVLIRTSLLPLNIVS
jgi:hypothetical protein